MAIALPWLEALCGLCLVIGYLSRGAILLVDMMMLVFIFALTMNIFRGIDVACGCFSLSTANSNRVHLNLARDVIILITGLAVLLYEIKQDQFAPDGFPRI